MFLLFLLSRSEILYHFRKQIKGSEIGIWVTMHCICIVRYYCNADDDRIITQACGNIGSDVPVNSQ